MRGRFRVSAADNIFRLCAAGPDAFTSIQASLSELLPDVDWDTAEQGKLIRGTLGNLRVNIERHTEFVSVTIIDADGTDQSAAKHLPDDWAQRLSGEIVVAVDCLCRRAGPAPMAGHAPASWRAGWLRRFLISKWLKTGIPKFIWNSTRKRMCATLAAWHCKYWKSKPIDHSPRWVCRMRAPPSPN